MTTKELIAELEKISHERQLEAHHDDMFFMTYSDVEALDKVIALLKFLDTKKPDDKVSVAELTSFLKE